MTLDAYKDIFAVENCESKIGIGVPELSFPLILSSTSVVRISSVDFKSHLKMCIYPEVITFPIFEKKQTFFIALKLKSIITSEWMHIFRKKLKSTDEILKTNALLKLGRKLRSGTPKTTFRSQISIAKISLKSYHSRPVSSSIELHIGFIV